MANYYLHFVAALRDVTAEEKRWLELQTAEECENREWSPTDTDEQIPAFELEFHQEEPNGGWTAVFSSDEWGDPLDVAALVQAYLKRFHPDSTWWMTWADVCDKNRINAFGGGYVFVTAATIKLENTWDAAGREVAAWAAAEDKTSDSAASRNVL